MLLEYSLRSRIDGFGDFNFPLPHRVISGKHIVRKPAKRYRQKMIYKPDFRSSSY